MPIFGATLYISSRHRPRLNGRLCDRRCIPDFTAEKKTEMVWGPIAVFAVSLLAGTETCSIPAGLRPPTVDEQILYAEQVLFGEVWRTFPDNSGMPATRDRYTAEVRVYCILQGRRSPQIINITDVGLFIASHDFRHQSVYNFISAR